MGYHDCVEDRVKKLEASVEGDWIKKTGEDGNAFFVHKDDSTRIRRTIPDDEISIQARLDRLELMCTRAPKINRACQILKGEIVLHQETPTWELPVSDVPEGTFAILLGVYYIHGDSGATHGFLTFTAHQKGFNSPTDMFQSPVTQHYTDYANTDYYEVLVPWHVGENILVVKVTYSHNSSTLNYYNLECRGFMFT